MSTGAGDSEEKRVGGREVEVTLRLGLTEPVSGSVLGGDGRLDTFTGWLELNAAMLRLLEEARTGSG
jgi:hypothetical protein